MKLHSDDRFKQRILRNYFVRFHMGLMVTATVAAGVVASKLLLEAGLTTVLIRYPLAVLGAYAVFVVLVKVWIGCVTLTSKRSTAQSLDVVDAVDLDVTSSGDHSRKFEGFGGGDSGGAGASDSWGSPQAAVATKPASGRGWNVPDIDGPDVLWVFVLLAGLIVGIFGAAGYLIYASYEILPEVALNALLAPALARAAKRAEQDGWLRSIVRSTWAPWVLILTITSGLAIAIHQHCPGANKLMDALHCSEPSESSSK